MKNKTGKELQYAEDKFYRGSTIDIKELEK